MLVHIKQLFSGDWRGNFAYPAFNSVNLETTLGIIKAAENLQVPVIIETSEGAIKYSGLKILYNLIASAVESCSVPIALHMDHGKDVVQLQAGIDLGYSSAMIDHSSLPFEENVHDTSIFANYAHSHGAWVQGEIGKISGTEDWVSVKQSESYLTDPSEALLFYQKTQVDTLACAFGTVHGRVKIDGGVKPKVDIQRIKDISSLVNIPLVLHGASGVDEATLHKAIAAGIGIVNIDTELRFAFSEALRKALAENPQEIDLRKYLTPAIDAVAEAATHKLLQLKTKNLIH